LSGLQPDNQLFTSFFQLVSKKDPVTEVAKLCPIMKKSSDEIKRWYAVYSKPRWEKKVHSLLDQQGFECYCPLNKVRKKWSDRYKVVHEPLFKSYLFVRITEAQKTPVRLTDGIVNFVYWLGKPAVVRNEDIEKIKRFLNEYSDVEVEIVDFVESGTTVKINQGVFMNLKGKVIQDRKKSVTVEIQSLGCRLVANFSKSQIDLIEKPIKK